MRSSSDARVNHAASVTSIGSDSIDSDAFESCDSDSFVTASDELSRSSSPVLGVGSSVVKAEVVDAVAATHSIRIPSSAPPLVLRRESSAPPRSATRLRRQLHLRL